MCFSDVKTAVWISIAIGPTTNSDFDVLVENSGSVRPTVYSSLSLLYEFISMYIVSKKLPRRFLSICEDMDKN